MLQFQQQYQASFEDEIVENCVINHDTKSLLQEGLDTSSRPLTFSPEVKIIPEIQYQKFLASRRRRRDTDGGRDWKSTQNVFQKKEAENGARDEDCKDKDDRKVNSLNECSNQNNNHSSTILCNRIITNSWLFGEEYVERINDSEEKMADSLFGMASSSSLGDANNLDYHSQTRFCNDSCNDSPESTTNRPQRPPKSSPITIPKPPNESSFLDRISSSTSSESSNKILQEYSFSDVMRKSEQKGRNSYEITSCNCEDEQRVSSTSMAWFDEDFNQEIADLMVKQNIGTSFSLVTPTSTTARPPLVIDNSRKTVEAFLLSKNRFKYTQTFDDCDSRPGTPSLFDEEDVLSEQWLLDEEYSLLKETKSSSWSQKTNNPQSSSKNPLSSDTSNLSSIIVCHKHSSFLPISPA